MGARIEAIEGVLRGNTFRVDGSRFTIGRDSDNHLAIPDLTISRRHCEIQAVSGEEDAFQIVDLDSVNGVYVNNRKEASVRLRHGDRFAIGSCTFAFLAHDCERSLAFEEDASALGATVELEPGECWRFTDLRADSQHSRYLETVIGFLRGTEGLSAPAAIERAAMTYLFRALPCTAGVIALSAPPGLELHQAIGWADGLGETPPHPVSRTIIRRVLERALAILSSDVLSDESLRGVESVDHARARSIIAVPLRAGERIKGIVYLEAAGANAFDEDHLKVAAAIGSIAGLAIDSAERLAWLEHENRRLEEACGVRTNMVGDSSPMKQVYERVRRIAPSECTVLILGESGTGKELAARSIHRGSERAGHPFLAINCAVLSEALLESDLFGHEKGAFTGAIARRPGKLEQADGGTLFLDEVGELAPTLQSRLLRVIQEREFERVGGTHAIKVDVRILAATNRDLQAEAARGQFRLDLYYRLAVVSLTMPPLRARPLDIPLLAEHFLETSKLARRRIRGISPEARACLMRYPWPGNVRELQNAMERAIVLGSGDWVTIEDLPEEVICADSSSDSSGLAPYHEGLRRAKHDLILKSLREAGGDVRAAARLLGVHVTYLYRLIRQLDIEV
jgi:Nif-specific regulatory protein